MKKKFDFKQFMLEKGERAGLIGAGAVALLLMVMTLFMPGRGLFSRGASANAEDLSKKSQEMARRQQSAQPGPRDQPPPVGDVVTTYQYTEADPTRFATRWMFFPRTQPDTKRQKPDILEPTDVRVAVVQVPLQSMALVFRNKKPIQVWVHKGSTGTGYPGLVDPAGTGGPADLLGGNNYYGGTGGVEDPGGEALGGGVGAPGAPGGAGYPGGRGMFGRGGPPGMARGSGLGGFTPPNADADLKPVDVEDFRPGTHNPAWTVFPVRMAVIAASFPYKKQVEEFRQKLRLDTHNQVITGYEQAGKEIWPTFAFRGVEVQRRELLADGTATEWYPVDVDRAYRPIMNRAYRQFMPEGENDKEMAQILDVSLVQRPVRLWDERGKYPNLVDDLKGIQDTKAKLKEEAAANAVIPPSNYFSDEGSTFGAAQSLRPADGGNFPGQPGMGFRLPPGYSRGAGGTGEVGNPEDFYGYLGSNQKYGDQEETPIDYCLVRFFDPTIVPGVTYQYRFKVKMANPNWSDKPARRKDTYPQFAHDKELKSGWVMVPGTVRVPPESYIYAVDQSQVEPRYTPRYNPEHRSLARTGQAVVQVHRWVDFFRPSLSQNNLQAVGDWLIAHRLVINRGEFVLDPAYQTKVPIKRPAKQGFTLAVNTDAKTERGKHLMSVPFGDFSILVDIQGGDLDYTKPAAGEESGDVVRVKAPRELVILRPDGRLIVRNSARDKEDKTRKDRYQAWLDWVKKIETPQGTPGTNPFGSGGAIP